jgi:hypothetical protein
MSFKLRHPFSGAVYEACTEDVVRVEVDGRWGDFDDHGNWLGGDLRSADPEMCRWVASRKQVEARLGGSTSDASRDRRGAFEEIGFDRVISSIRRQES